MDDIKCGGFTFIRNFDSANLAKVELVPFDVTNYVTATSQNTSRNSNLEIPDIEFNMWTRADCAGTQFENANRTWFHFGMKSHGATLLVKINVVDINRQAKMFSQGMCPVYKVYPVRNIWERIRERISFTCENEIFTLSFKYHTPENPQSITYFAFTYPFSYIDLQKMLIPIDEKFLHTSHDHMDDIYYVRELVCNSLDGRRVDLITISSYRGISTEREVRIKYLFPERHNPRPYMFPTKKVIFISARVHPGETPSSFVFNGLLNLILCRDDPVAIALRKYYVFKMIPFLNPDGVSRGHYRTDCRGVNLNRVYLGPLFEIHPSVYAARALVRYYHYGYEKPDVIIKCPNCSDMRVEFNRVDEEVQATASNRKVAQSSLDEKTSSSWNYKCKEQVSSLEESFSRITTLAKSFKCCSDNLGKHLCKSCGSPLVESSSDESIEGVPDSKSVGSHGDISSNESGVFMYMDLHGHASKKGIFIYGNHFETIEKNVECMLLPKIMTINNQNFDFTACNFSERNMYIEDKRDGLSRAGSGRVAISTITGIVKCYTLECNYNTGRYVNILPTTVKERYPKSYNSPIPPKYNPAVFEEVGRSIGASILDLTGHNPITRIPHSEFHSLGGVIDWLRSNCIHGFGESILTKMKLKGKSNTQGKSRKLPSIKPVNNGKTNKSKPMSSNYIDLKENVSEEDEVLCLDLCNSNMNSKREKTTKKLKSKTKVDTLLKSKNYNDKDKTKLKHITSFETSFVLRAPKQTPFKSVGKLNEQGNGCQSFINKIKSISKKMIYEGQLIYAWNSGATFKEVLQRTKFSTSMSHTTKFGSEPIVNKTDENKILHTKSSQFQKNKKLIIRRTGSTDCLSIKAKKVKRKRKFLKKVIY